MSETEHIYLPEGWKWNKLGEICAKPEYGWTTSASDNGNLKLLRTTDITPGYITWDKVPFCKDNPPNTDKYLLKDGDIVISRAGSVGYSHLISDPERAVFASYLIRFRPVIIPKYVAYYLKSPMFWRAIEENKLGIAVPNVNASKLSQIHIPVAPLAEQERIVAQIEELFTQLDAGVAALEAVKGRVRRYRQAVLQAAMGGNKLKSPENWSVVSMEQISDIKGGVTKGRNLVGKKTVTLPYLRVANVQRGYLDLQEIKEIEVLEDDIEKYRLVSDDLLLTEGGDWDKLGRAAVWNDQISNCIHQNHIFRARVVSSDVSAKWIMYYLNSEQGKSYFKNASKQTTNLASINMSQLRACPVAFPSKEVQDRVILQMEEKFSIADQTEISIDQSLRQAARLRQSILQRAFTGKLSTGA